MSHSFSSSSNFDLTIVGAGVIGSLLTYAALQQGFSCLLLEQNSWSLPEKIAAPLRPSRAYALSHESLRIFQSFGLLEELVPYLSPLHRVVVRGETLTPFIGHSHATPPSWSALFFSPELSPSTSQNRFREQYPLGALLLEEDLLRLLRAKLTNYAHKNPKSLLKISEQSHLQGFSRYENHVDFTLTCPSLPDSPSQLRSQWLLSCEGKNSEILQALNLSVFHKNYQQRAIVATIAHDKPHHATAFEDFCTLQDGITPSAFALLPLLNSKERYLSSLVLSTPTISPLFTDSSERPIHTEKVLQELQQCFSSRLGRLEAASSFASFPLSMHHCKHYGRPSVLLLGDAAHSIHPLTGQGLNLGIRDVHAVISALVEQLELATDNKSVLAKYEQARFSDNLLTLTATDQFARTLMSPRPLLRKVSALSLHLVDQSRPLKSWILNQVHKKPFKK